MDALVQAMTKSEVLEALKLYKGNARLEPMLKTALQDIEAREQTEANIKAFSDKVAKLAKLPVPPSDVHNIILYWKEVEVSDGKPQDVVIDGKHEMREGIIKQWQWEVTTNHACYEPSKAKSSTTPKTAKLAIRVYKRNGSTLDVIGEYANATKACEALKLVLNGDSGTRVLQRNGYFVEAINS